MNAAHLTDDQLLDAAADAAKTVAFWRAQAAKHRTAAEPLLLTRHRCLAHARAAEARIRDIAAEFELRNARRAERRAA